jgi:hypothetical protein
MLRRLLFFFLILRSLDRRWRLFNGILVPSIITFTFMVFALLINGFAFRNGTYNGQVIKLFDYVCIE